MADGAVFDRRRWYILHTHPAAEYRVRRWLDRAPPENPSSPKSLHPMVVRDFRSKHHLARDGYEIWLPECVVVTSTRRCRSISRKGPWFPGYMFIRLDLACQGWREFEDVDGVAGFLLDGGRPYTLPEARIAGLRAACEPETGVVVIDADRPRHYARDQLLRVVQGPFTSYNALFSHRAKDRIVAVLDLFGRRVEVEFDEAQIEPV